MVLTCGSICSNSVEQVKGVTYSLDRFLGPDDWPRVEQVRGVWYSLCRLLGLVGSTDADVKLPGDDDTDYVEEIKCHKKDTELYQAVIYLSPGDYHRFHSPTEWTVTFRRYFPGLIFVYLILLLLLQCPVFSARCKIYISCLCYDVSIRLSVCL